MRSSTIEQYGSWAEVAGFQSSSPTSWRSPSTSSRIANGEASSRNQPVANTASYANQPQFDSMMASLLQSYGSTNGANGSISSSGVSDDVQFTTGANGAPLLGNLRSLLSIQSDRGAASAAANETGASPASSATSSAVSSGSTGQASLPPWAAGWFNVGASTESATTGWSDPFGQPSSTLLNQNFSQAASAYAAASHASNTPSVTNVTV